MIAFTVIVCVGIVCATIILVVRIVSGPDPYVFDKRMRAIERALENYAAELMNRGD